MSEKDSLEQQIKQWVISADKYHYLLESEEDYITREITKLAIEFGKEAYKAGQKKYLTGLPSFVTEHDYNEWIASKKK